MYSTELPCFWNYNIHSVHIIRPLQLCVWSAPLDNAHRELWDSCTVTSWQMHFLQISSTDWQQQLIGDRVTWANLWQETKIPQCLENVIGNQSFKHWKYNLTYSYPCYCSLTLRLLSVYEFLYQGIRRLCVKAKSVFQRLQVWALFQEILFQSTSSSMEVLLKGNTNRFFREENYLREASVTDIHF